MRRWILMVAVAVMLFAGVQWMAMGGSDEILVVASPLPGSADQLGRFMEVADYRQLQSCGAMSVADAIEALTSVSVSQRGETGVQSDLSLRGSTFQQVLLTLDGLPLTDQQTAHHNMDLPMPLDALNRITIIPGPGSALFGPSAFAGVIDLDPRVPEATGLKIRGGYGSFDTRRVSATADFVEEGHSATLSLEYSDSDGFQEGTDYDILSLWLSAVTVYPFGSLRCSVGQTFKDFGARDFYAEYPSREKTALTFVDASPLFELGADWALKINVRYREHEDDFILLDYNPTFYRNENTSESFTERALLESPDFSLGRTVAGIERTDSMLESSNLGDRDMFVNSAFVQHRITMDSLGADLGIRIDDHDRWGTEVSPSLGVNLQASDCVGISLSAARGIRPPSFTELYYSDPANAGDENLEVEKSWGGEVSLALDLNDETSVRLTCFRNDADELIDWVRASSNEVWQAANIGKATTMGAEVSAQLFFWGLEARPSYRYTDLDADSGGLESKYALNLAEHDVGMNLLLSNMNGFTVSVSGRYRDVPTLDNYWLLSAKISKEIGMVTVYALGKNLLDQEYQEIPGVPTAGSYAELGLALSL